MAPVDAADRPPSGARTVLLVRHGRTALNAAGRLRGLADPPLDDAGLEQADALARALRDRGVTAVRSSPLQRARTTAAPIARAAGVPVRVDARFTDRDYGPWTGAPIADVEAAFGSADAAPGVEPADRVVARVRPALDACLDEVPVGVLVVVTHDAVIRPLLDAIAGARRTPRVPNGSWCELLRTVDGDARRWRVGAVDVVP